MKKLLVVVIIAIIGFVWWMNKNGAGGPSKADATPIAPAERPVNPATELLRQHQEQQRKREATQRAMQDVRLPTLTYDQMRQSTQR